LSEVSGTGAALPPLSLYIHLPWCIRKCPYCDFNSHELKENLPEQAYVDALLADLDGDLRLLESPRPITSIFIGGGTPSLFSPEALQYLLNQIKQRTLLAAPCEITLEANPGAVESGKFKAFRAIGINRLSLGVQSFNNRHLQTLGRIHNADEALRAVQITSDAGFENFNLDLMFGLPGQTARDAEQDIESAVSLNPTHISFYQFTLEPNTYFYKFPPELPAEDEIFLAQKACQRLLSTYGYQQYEISAYAKAGYQCGHNRNYWRFGDYLGIGAGAHGKISLSLPNRIIRTAKIKNPENYLKLSASMKRELIEVAQLPLEFLMNHLRLVNGFNLYEYTRSTGLDRTSLEPALTQCINQKLLTEQGQQIYCTEKGWDFLDLILEKFVPSPEQGMRGTGSGKLKKYKA
jgi:oxygen-independent coproporphyrinogen-3 oxidase